MNDKTALSEPELSSDTLKRFSLGGVVYDQVKGLGAVTDVANIDRYGFVALMRPSVFLSLCPPLEADRDRLSSVMDAGGPVSMGFLVINMADEALRVRQHEGRHRTYEILRRHGDEPIPVAFLFNGGDRADDITPDDIARIASGLRRERTSEEPKPPVIDGPLFDRVLHLGRGYHISEECAPALC